MEASMFLSKPENCEAPTDNCGNCNIYPCSIFKHGPPFLDEAGTLNDWHELNRRKEADPYYSLIFGGSGKFEKRPTQATTNLYDLVIKFSKDIPNVVE